MQEIVKELENNLKRHLDTNSYNNFFHEVYDYSLLPPGKLFRPLLVWSVSQDFNSKNFSQNHQKLASFTEIHHAYTLIHDDMPDMDNDEIRRNRLTTHKKFGNWQALLSGDGLLNMSYALLAKLQHTNAMPLLNYASWALGPKGLILGQALDLSEEMTKSFPSLLLTHQLKTARLIQVCLVGSYLLSEDEEATIKTAKSLHRLGHHMGIAFQLLDDLCELSDESLSPHERKVNPWLRFQSKCYVSLSESLKYVLNFYNENKSESIKDIYGIYIRKIETLLTASQPTIEKHLNSELRPIIQTLNLISS